MYYNRIDVKRTILSFANPSGSNEFRECAIFNKHIKSLQRYVNNCDEKYPIILNTPSAITHAVSQGASAFYCSYWRYDGLDFDKPIGRDLVWTLRTKHGGLGFVKHIAALVVKAFEDIGIVPWVKYSGDLGFDLVIPLDTIPHELWMGQLDVLDDLQKELTDSIVSQMYKYSHNIEIKNKGASIEIIQEGKTCLLSELRARRGLLLAPMSLNPETGLVSVPVDPKRINSFSILDASPSNVKSFDWEFGSAPMSAQIGYPHSWRIRPLEAKPAEV